VRVAFLVTMATVVLLVCVDSRQEADASSIIVPSWQVQVADAGFIGIADCVVAGGIVARYRVVESWKGPPKGSELLIGQRVDNFGSQYPLALVGERYFFVVDSARGAWALPPQPGLPSYFQSFPPWWRRIVPEFHLAYFPTKLPLSPKNDFSWGILDFARLAPHESLDSFRVDVASILALGERALEIETLRASAQWFWRTSEGQPDSFTLPCPTPACVIVKGDSLEHVVAELIRLSRDRGGIGEVLYQGGRRETLRRLEEFADNTSTVLAASYLRSVKRKLRVRLGLEIPQPEPDPFENETIDRKTRERLLRSLRGEGKPDANRSFRQAFERLTVHDPESVAEFLVQWSPPQNASPYEIGSYFAYRCPQNRLRNLKKLLGARDPFVRVAGAVYLMLEGAPEGKTALEELKTFPGDAGAWAALTLARRGDKEAMAAALEVLREKAPYTYDFHYHREFQKRVLELLSNAAAASGMQLPLDWNPDYVERDEDTRPIYDAYSVWWKANSDRIILRDPWLDVLAAKKVD
jgi:hypothetical protein